MAVERRAAVEQAYTAEGGTYGAARPGLGADRRTL